ncbi:hypothetical protein CRG98_000583 [Punica granatum]|uniref:Uncharacterized protein n=1 Tax=Punica granatum TaxID=22663 RepID=A0A2I0LEF4_PUNGR|nr:hypothetical protein CRG98_000583 [Punica granatum]
MVPADLILWVPHGLEVARAARQVRVPKGRVGYRPARNVNLRTRTFRFRIISALAKLGVSFTPRPGQLTGPRPSGRKQVVSTPSHACPSLVPLEAGRSQAVRFGRAHAGLDESTFKSIQCQCPPSVYFCLTKTSESTTTGELEGGLPVLVRQCPCLEERGVHRSGALNEVCGRRSTVGGGQRGGGRGPRASNGGWGWEGQTGLGPTEDRLHHEESRGPRAESAKQSVMEEMTPTGQHRSGRN